MFTHFRGPLMQVVVVVGIVAMLIVLSLLPRISQRTSPKAAFVIGTSALVVAGACIAVAIFAL